MISEEELKREITNIRSFDKIKKFTLASFYKWKKKNEKWVILAVKKSLLDQVTANCS